MAGNEQHCSGHWHRRSDGRSHEQFPPECPKITGILVALGILHRRRTRSGGTAPESSKGIASGKETRKRSATPFPKRQGRATRRLARRVPLARALTRQCWTRGRHRSSRSEQLRPQSLAAPSDRQCHPKFVLIHEIDSLRQCHPADSRPRWAWNQIDSERVKHAGRGARGQATFPTGAYPSRPARVAVERVCVHSHR